MLFWVQAQVPLRHTNADLRREKDSLHLSSVEGLTGGVIRNVVLSAAFAAFGDSAGQVGQRHLTTALERELRKMGRRSTTVVGPRQPLGAQLLG